MYNHKPKNRAGKLEMHQTLTAAFTTLRLKKQS